MIKIMGCICRGALMILTWRLWCDMSFHIQSVNLCFVIKPLKRMQTEALSLKFYNTWLMMRESFRAFEMASPTSYLLNTDDVLFVCQDCKSSEEHTLRCICVFVCQREKEREWEVERKGVECVSPYNQSQTLKTFVF